MPEFGFLATLAWPIVAIIWIGIVYVGWRQDRSEKKQLAEAEIIPLKKKISEVAKKVDSSSKVVSKIEALESELRKLSNKINTMDY